MPSHGQSWSVRDCPWNSKEKGGGGYNVTSNSVGEHDHNKKKVESIKQQRNLFKKFLNLTPYPFTESYALNPACSF